jgi:hypothetical protein
VTPDQIIQASLVVIGLLASVILYFVAMTYSKVEKTHRFSIEQNGINKLQDKTNTTQELLNKVFRDDIDDLDERVKKIEEAA